MCLWYNPLTTTELSYFLQSSKIQKCLSLNRCQRWRSRHRNSLTPLKFDVISSCESRIVGAKVVKTCGLGLGSTDRPITDELISHTRNLQQASSHQTGHFLATGQWFTAAAGWDRSRREPVRPGRCGRRRRACRRICTESVASTQSRRPRSSRSTPVRTSSQPTHALRTAETTT